jgi:DNA-binding response OmpR family regulator
MTINIIKLDLAGKNIVIVDDDMSSIKYYEEVLRYTGANVKYFQTGKDFVDYSANESNKIDLVFMDFLIPLINGIDCVRIFRKERKTIPVIIITAYSSEQTKTEAHIAGCNEYLLKPIYPEKLYFLLEKYLMLNISVPSA